MFLKLKPCLKLTEDLFHEVWTGDVLYQCLKVFQMFGYLFPCFPTYYSNWCKIQESIEVMGNTGMKTFTHQSIPCYWFLSIHPPRPPAPRPYISVFKGYRKTLVVWKELLLIFHMDIICQVLFRSQCLWKLISSISSYMMSEIRLFVMIWVSGKLLWRVWNEILFQALKEYGQLDIMISNAAVNPAFGPVLNVRSFLDLLVLSPSITSKLFLKPLWKTSEYVFKAPKASHSKRIGWC